MPGLSKTPVQPQDCTCSAAAKAQVGCSRYPETCVTHYILEQARYINCFTKVNPFDGKLLGHEGPTPGSEETVRCYQILGCNPILSVLCYAMLWSAS